ncbi:hypothetical protein CR513_20420, partial [Mucuna pruriens]
MSEGIVERDPEQLRKRLVLDLKFQARGNLFRSTVTWFGRWQFTLRRIGVGILYPGIEMHGMEDVIKTISILKCDGMVHHDFDLLQNKENARLRFNCCVRRLAHGELFIYTDVRWIFGPNEIKFNSSCVTTVGCGEVA